MGFNRDEFTGCPRRIIQRRGDLTRSHFHCVRLRCRSWIVSSPFHRCASHKNNENIADTVKSSRGRSLDVGNLEALSSFESSTFFLTAFPCHSSVVSRDINIPVSRDAVIVITKNTHVARPLVRTKSPRSRGGRERLREIGARDTGGRSRTRRSGVHDQLSILGDTIVICDMTEACPRRPLWPWGARLVRFS